MSGQNSSIDLYKNGILEVPPKELEEAKEVALLIIKAVKMIRLYPENNAVLQKTVEEVYRKLVTFLDRYGELPLDLDVVSLSYRGQVVHSAPEKAGSIAFKLHQDGIRRLRLQQGLGEEELRDLLKALCSSFDLDELDDDLQTLLWEKDFEHIDYWAVDDAAEQEGMADVLSSSTSLTPEDSEGLASLDEDLPLALEPVELKEIHISRMFALTPEDIERLNALIEDAKRRDIFGELLDIMTEVFAYSTDMEAFTRVSEKMVELLRWQISRGNIVRCLELLDFLDGYKGAGSEMTREHWKVWENQLKKLSSLPVLEELASQLDQNPRLAEADVAALLRKTKGEVIPDLCQLLVNAADGRRLLALLVELGRDNMEPFMARLIDPNWQMVKYMVQILGAIANPEAVNSFSLATSHEDPRVRREAATQLANFPVALTSPLVTGCLSDPDWPVRMAALRIMERSSHKPFLEPIQQAMADKDFVVKEPAEKRRYFVALAKVGGNDALPFLDSILKGKGWIKKGRHEESRALAAEALIGIGTQEARAVLAKNKIQVPQPLKLVPGGPRGDRGSSSRE